MKKLTCFILLCLIISGCFIVGSCDTSNPFAPEKEKKMEIGEVVTKPEEKAETEPVTTAPPEVKTVASSELSKSQYKRLVSSFDSLIYSYGFEGEVYVTEHNKPIYKKGVNYADKKKKIKNNEYTIFRAASITKQFTAAAVMILQERGKLSVKDKLSKYFPEYQHADKITLDDVLRMRAGIPDYMNFYSNVANLFPKKTDPFKNTSAKNRAFIKKSFMEDPLLFTPGATFKYSNSGYLLLGEIIEKVSGQTYENFIQTEIFDKLGMKYSGFIENMDKSLGKNIARPYNYSKGQTDVFKIKGAAYACGNIYSNAVDLAKWADGLRKNKIMSAKSFKAMISDKGSGYGYGLFVQGNGKIVFHTGNLAPYNSIILLSMGGNEFTSIVLSNYNYYASERLGKALREVYAGYF